MTETTDQLMKRLHGNARGSEERSAPAEHHLSPSLEADHDPVARIRHDRTMPVFVAEGYDSLFIVLCKALHQAQDGKGKERHAQPNTPFDQQPIMGIATLTDMGFQTGQAIKKTVEAHGMVNRKQLDAAERELLGAINYLAAAVLRINKIATAEMKGH